MEIELVLFSRRCERVVGSATTGTSVTGAATSTGAAGTAGTAGCVFLVKGNRNCGIETGILDGLFDEMVEMRKKVCWFD